jgi:hypothetical protein
MDLTTTKIVVLVVVGLIIMVALLGEFRPRSRARRAHRTVLVPVPVGTGPGADRVGAA